MNECKPLAHGATRGIADHSMHAYLIRGPGAAEAAKIIARESEDDSLKMVNLARDWQGLTPVHFSTQSERFLWDRGVFRGYQGVFRVYVQRSHRQMRLRFS